MQKRGGAKTMAGRSWCGVHSPVVSKFQPSSTLWSLCSLTFFYFFVQLMLCSCSFSNPQYNGNSHKFILIKKIIYFCLQFNTFVFYIQMITRFVQILCDLCHVSDFLYFSGQYKWCCLSFTNNLLVSVFPFFYTESL